MTETTVETDPPGGPSETPLPDTDPPGGPSVTPEPDTDPPEGPAEPLSEPPAEEGDDQEAGVDVDVEVVTERDLEDAPNTETDEEGVALDDDEE